MIGLLNCDETLKNEISKSTEIVEVPSGDLDNISTVFIDWKPRKETIEYEASFIEYCISKKIKIILFDRYFMLPKKEIQRLKENDAVLLEPSIINRYGFEYFSHWIKKRDFDDLDVINTKRKIDLFFSDKINSCVESFEKYYVKFSDLYPEKLVQSTYMIEEKSNEWLNIKTGGNLQNSKSVVLIGHKKEYEIGHLNPIFVDCIENCVVPLLPEEHRFFYPIFEGLIVNDISKIENVTVLHENIQFGMIFQIYERIEKFFPEMFIENAVNRILEYVR